MFNEDKAAVVELLAIPTPRPQFVTSAMTDLAGVDAELAQVAYQEAKDLAAATVSPRHRNELKKAYDKLKAADDEMLKAVQLAALGQYDKAIDLSCKAWQESVLAKDYVRRATL